MPYRSPPPRRHLHVAARTATGPVRRVNDDAVAVFPLATPRQLGSWALGGIFPVDEGVGLVVLDGIGGMGAGSLVCEIVLRSLHASFCRELPAGTEPRRAWLLEALRRASVTVLEERQLQGAGATAVVALAAGEELHVVHAGEVRAYLMADGRLTQVTRDDSLINDVLARAPKTSEEDLAKLPKNAITRALGISRQLPDRVTTFPLREGATVLIASDGLHAVVGEAEIERVLVGAADPIEACSTLQQMAEAANAQDNISVLVARVEPSADARR